MKRELLHLLTTSMVAACLVSCAGYEIGGRKPASLSNVERIAVPMITNATQHPRAEALATSALADAITRDGTYRISAVGNADAVLEGTLQSINYTTLRGNRFDTMQTEEFSNTVTIQWLLRDARNPTRILAGGSSNGRSQIFSDSNLQTSRNNALNEALENAAESLVFRIANSY